MSSELQLLERARGGDAEAFGELVRGCQERIYMLALQMTRNHADADELSQLAFLKAYEALPRFRADSGFFTWVYRITINLCLSHLKNQSRYVPLPGSVDANEDSPSPAELAGPDRAEQPVEQAEEVSRVQKALRSLGPELRAAAIAVYIDDMTPRQAAQALGCAEATIYWRLFKARKILSRQLEE
jgi:RNA polymerase sigma-70 factor, ECF subfamily